MWSLIPAMGATRIGPKTRQDIRLVFRLMNHSLENKPYPTRPFPLEGGEGTGRKDNTNEEAFSHHSVSGSFCSSSCQGSGGLPERYSPSFRFKMLDVPWTRIASCG